jgi:hypothetical protein
MLLIPIIVQQTDIFKYIPIKLKSPPPPPTNWISEVCSIQCIISQDPLAVSVTCFICMRLTYGRGPKLDNYHKLGEKHAQTSVP